MTEHSSHRVANLFEITKQRINRRSHDEGSKKIPESTEHHWVNNFQKVPSMIHLNF